MRTIENNSATATAHVQTPFFQKESKGFFNSGESSDFFIGTQHGTAATCSGAPAGSVKDAGEREPDEMIKKKSQAKGQDNVQRKCAGCEAEEEVQKKENKPDEEKEEPSASTAPDETGNKTDPATAAGTEDPQEATAPGEPTPPGVGVTPVPGEEEEGMAAAPPVAMVYAMVQPMPVVQAVPQIQRRANISFAPRDLSCILMDVGGTPGPLNVFFGQNDSLLDGGDLTDIENFVGTWVAGGLSDDLLVGGFASEEGTQSHNWRLSCERAQAVTAELRRIGVPDTKISTFAHGETTDFDATNHEPNRRATVTTSPGTGPTITPVLTPGDNFAGRSTTEFGVGEGITITYTATPSIAAAEHFGVDWSLVFGGGTVTSALGTGLYTAGSTSGVDVLTLNVNTGPAAGTPLAVATPFITAPTLAYIQQVPGSGVCHTNGKATAGFHGEIFMMPTLVSFRNCRFSEGTGTLMATGSLSHFNGRAHTPTATPPGIGSGNAGVGCKVNGFDTITTGEPLPAWRLFGPNDWAGTYIWPIEWQYIVGASGPTTFMTANQIVIIDTPGNASISKAASPTFRTALADPTSAIGGPFGGGTC